MPRHLTLPAAALSVALALAAGCSPQSPAPAAAGPDPAASAETAPEAQQVALFSILPIRADAESVFLPVMLGNVQRSREEPGAIGFDVFQPEAGGSTLYLFERWRDAAAVERHFATPNLQAVERALPAALGGEAVSLTLKEVPPYGTAQRRPPADPAASRNVIVRLQVRPEREQAFLDALAEVTPHARSAPGNAAFELYRVEDQPQHYVLFEHWDDAQSHEAHLVQPYSKALDAVLPGTLAAPIDERSRFLVRDIAG